MPGRAGNRPDAPMTVETTAPRDEEAVATLARAYSFSNEAMYMVSLQCRRIRSSEPEDRQFVLRWWADLQFLIIALWRLRSAGVLALQSGSDGASLEGAIDSFDSTLPHLRRMRNVGEHVVDYAMENGRDRVVQRRQLQAGSFDGTSLFWLDVELNIDLALGAAERLHHAVKDAAVAAAFPRSGSA